MKSEKEAWEERRKRGWQRLTDKWEHRKGEKGILDKNKSFGYLMTKKAAEDSKSTLIFEVNSVQSLLLFNAFLAKQCK